MSIFKKKIVLPTVTIFDAKGEEKEKYEVSDAEAKKEKVEDEEKEITDEEVKEKVEDEKKEEYVYDANEVKEVYDACKDMGYEKMSDAMTALKSYKDAEAKSEVLNDEAKKKKNEPDVLQKLKDGEQKIADEAKKKMEAKLSDEEKKAKDIQVKAQKDYDKFLHPNKKEA
ncbi:hypothetical protein DRO61_00915 [Candidatus Bathyarchaeota archaeon]|nr:MAG: hypothetical protein DRO61_00915 [Candidatus Bathyarchaeota archaeon]